MKKHHLRPLLCRPDQNIMDLHVLWSREYVGHSISHVFSLQAGQGTCDGCCFRWVIWVHGRLELGLHQPRGDGSHPYIGPQVSHFLSPAFQQTSHCKLGSSIEPNTNQCFTYRTMYVYCYLVEGLGGTLCPEKELTMTICPSSTPCLVMDWTLSWVHRHRAGQYWCVTSTMLLHIHTAYLEH